MNCQKCNAPIRDGSKFCPHCGVPQNIVPQMPPQKPKSKLPIILAMIAAIFIIAAAVAFVFMSGMVGESSEKTDQSVAVEVKEESEENAAEESALSEKEQKELEELEAQFEALSAMDTSTAFGSERDMIATYKINVEKYLKDLKFGEARFEMIYWQNLLDAISGQGQYVMNVEQVDVSEYPKVKIYLRVEDKTTLEAVSTLTKEGFIVHEKVGGSVDFVRREVLRASQLNNLESLNISMVADVSGSMRGSKLSSAKSVMAEFLNSVQPSAGDKVSLITFDDTADIMTAFTNDMNLVANQINAMQDGGQTALYDALFLAVNQTAAQDGAKCVIAFTDGADNRSNCTPQIVSELAQRYSIPIYLIGIGSGYSSSDLEYITTSTGGYYWSVGEISNMADLYNTIFREQKEMYLVEYETLQQDDSHISRNLNLDYVDEIVAVRQEYTYVPKIYMEVVVSGAQMFVNDFIIYDSNTRYVTSADLDRLTAEQLSLARNEIYARRGRRFNRQDLQAYFDSKSWYTGTIAPNSFSESYFNDYERANAYFIADYERLKGYIK